MELTLQQSLQLHINSNKQNSIQNKYIFTTKTKWWCLNCMTIIYVSYKSYGRNAIFCSECYPKFARLETAAQYRYMAKLKDTQLKLVESNLNF